MTSNNGNVDETVDNRHKIKNEDEYRQAKEAYEELLNAENILSKCAVMFLAIMVFIFVLVSFVILGLCAGTSNRYYLGSVFEVTLWSTWFIILFIVVARLIFSELIKGDMWLHCHR